MAAVAGKVWNNEEDTSRLFQNHTVDEIRQIEKKTRTDIEKKKEDLRQMVGERYPELIDAADTIIEMKHCSTGIVGSVDRMHEQCKELKEIHQCRGITNEAMDGSDALDRHETAHRLKCLVDTPEKIWTALESQKHLEAAFLYLKAQKIIKTGSDEHQLLGQVFQHFPILQQQWASVSHFKDAVLQESRQLLQSHSTAPKTTAESLCSILLLEESTPRQVFTEFLVARKAAIQALFHSSQQATSVKSQVCTLVAILVSTITQVDAIFIQSQPDTKCLLLEVITSGSEASTQPSIPNFLSRLNAIRNDVLHSSCQEWMTTCLQDVTSGLQVLLSYITAIKSLANIRDAVHALLLSQDIDNRPDRPSKWRTSCLAVVGRQVSVWDEFVRPLVVKRVEELVAERLTALTEEAKRLTDDALDRLSTSSECPVDRDVALFVWSEQSGGGSLQCQARGCTPMITGICLGVENQLSGIIADVGLFLGDVSAKDGPFDCFADGTHLKAFMHTQGCHLIKGWTEWIQMRLRSMRDEIIYYGVDHTGLVQGVNAVDRCLFLGRLCRSLLEESSNLERLVSGSHEARKSTRLARRVHSAEDSVSQLGREVKDALHDVYMSSHRIWIGWVTNIVGEQMKLWLLNGGNDAAAWLYSTNAWEDIKVHEESEGGKAIESKIELPFQVSTPVMSLLFGLCQEISRVSSYSIDRSIKGDLLKAVYSEIVSVYERLRESSVAAGGALNQRWAVQLSFDLRFMTELLNEGRKTDTTTKAVHDWLDSRIDPFDLSVFQPFLEANLSKHIHRASVVLGLLYTASVWTKHGGHGAKRSAGSRSQEQANVVALSAGAPRFTLLPHQASSLPRPVFNRQPVAVNPNVRKQTATPHFASALLAHSGGGVLPERPDGSFREGKR